MKAPRTGFTAIIHSRFYIALQDEISVNLLQNKMFIANNNSITINYDVVQKKLAWIVYIDELVFFSTSSLFLFLCLLEYFWDNLASKIMMCGTYTACHTSTTARILLLNVPTRNKSNIHVNVLVGEHASHKNTKLLTKIPNLCYLLVM